MRVTANTGQPQDDNAALLAALLDPAVYGLPASERIEKIETHISYVFLAGEFAYKIKKPVDLGFLNFGTLRARHFYCEEELRLNRRLAPALYLDVVAITGSPAHPVLGGDGAPIEYAVKMRRFPQDGLFDRLLTRNALTPEHIDALAMRTAAFHDAANVATDADTFGTPAAIEQPAIENFTQLRAAGAASAALDSLEQWTSTEVRALQAIFSARKHDGFVRECHGDLHLRNVALIDGEVTLFDCIEFDANLRWIDVMNDAAFLVMDLHDRQRPVLARRFLNRYLEITGDYAGLRVLRFYVVYRALVRAKIHWLRVCQPGVGAAERDRVREQYGGYIALALAQTRGARPALIITHGLSGSGKTTCTQALVERLGAVRVRSDVERKRLQGLDALARTASGLAQGAYATDATTHTYARLLELAQIITASGYPAIVDATFLKRAQRDQFRKFALAQAIPFAIVDVVADNATLRARIIERQRRQTDPSEADINVLEHQLATEEPLAPDEQAFVVRIESAAPPDPAAWASALQGLGIIAE